MNVVPTFATPITKQRLKRRTSKSGQYNTVMAMLRRMDKEKEQGKVTA